MNDERVQIVGEASDGKEAVHLIDTTTPDVVIMDLRLPDGSGLEATRALRKNNANMGIVVLTMYAGDDQLFGALEAGASAWVRINDITTPYWEQDLAALSRVGPLRGIMLAKTEHPDHITKTAMMAPAGTPVVALIESAVGIMNANDIARAPGVFRLAFGVGDFRRDTGVSADPMALAFARWRGERQLRRADGSLVWVHSEGRVADRTSSGMPLRMVGTNRDITQDKLAQQELRVARGAFDPTLSSDQRGEAILRISGGADDRLQAGPFRRLPPAADVRALPRAPARDCLARFEPAGLSARPRRW